MFMIQVKIPGLIIQELGLGDKEKLRFILGEKSWPEYIKILTHRDMTSATGVTSQLGL